MGLTISLHNHTLYPMGYLDCVHPMKSRRDTLFLDKYEFVCLY